MNALTSAREQAKHLSRNGKELVVMLRFIYTLFAFLLFLQQGGFADDWPTFRHDLSRSGISGEALAPPLKEAWRYTAKHPPQPAWPGPARADGWHKVENLKPRVIFDWAFHTVSSGGDVFFGSSADDKVYCLDGGTGQERWTFFTDGPVRLSPTIHQGKIYAGSDDGKVYCLQIADGTLLWKYNAGPRDSRVPGNGRLMSLWPIRSGLVVDQGVVYFSAGLFPFEGAFLCAVGAEDGKEVWKREVPGFAPQGYLAASAEKIFVPTGRGTPFVFGRADGDYLYALGGSGGAFCLLTEDRLVYGPGKTGVFEAFQPGEKEEFATFEGNQMIVTPERSYLQSDTEIRAIDRVRYFEISLQRSQISKQMDELKKQIKSLEKLGDDEGAAELRKKQGELESQSGALTAQLSLCLLWKQPSKHPYSLILAGETLYAGGTGSVAAFSTENGEQIWNAEVEGRALDLQVSGEKLVASTDRGAIYAFIREEPQGETR
jgi:outer membrane protein assembly factor BamB